MGATTRDLSLRYTWVYTTPVTLVRNFLTRAQTKCGGGVHLIPDVTAPKPYILLAQLLPPVEINRKVKHWTQQVSRPSDLLEGGGAGGNFTTASF